jgi:hypothetical protein
MPLIKTANTTVLLAVLKVIKLSQAVATLAVAVN